MKIGFIKENQNNEKRTAITPETAKLLTKYNHKIFIEENISLDFSNQDHSNSAINFCKTNKEVIENSDILCKISPSATISRSSFPELQYGKKDNIILGMFSPFLHEHYIKEAHKKKISLVSMNLLPRISKLQNMDVLSSQNSLIGYRAVLEACFLCQKSFPMMMSAAGTIFATKVLILGTGVAGLQAIATAKRLGATVSAYDVRYSTKEQVESLGAKFIHPGEISDAENNSGYAENLDINQEKIQEDFLYKNIGQFDIILTFAQIPNSKSPVLINERVFSAIKKDTIIVDTTTEYGGNVIFSKKDEVVNINNIDIIGYSNLASRISKDASALYAKNIAAFLNSFINNEERMNLEDPLIKQMIL